MFFLIHDPEGVEYAANPEGLIAIHVKPGKTFKV